jgi:hypothetical protein
MNDKISENLRNPWWKNEISVGADFLCFKFISKWKWFHWMAFRPRIPRYLWIQLILVIIGIGLAFGIAYFVVRLN